jgi:1-acyl-sn-glycerol-3-phosphate acyltransferase
MIGHLQPPGRSSGATFSIDRAARLVVYFPAMAIVSLYCEVAGRIWCKALAPAGSPDRVRRANRVTRHWNIVLTRLTLWAFKARLDVRGTVPPGRFIVISNHQSIADIAILASSLAGLNVKFVAKEELGRGIPAVSLALREWGSALISRNGSRRDLARLRAMAAGLEHWNGSIAIFPEGTRSRDGKVQAFKPAAVRIVSEVANLPILPVAIDGTYAASDLIGFAKNLSGAHGTLTIGQPIPPEAWRGNVDQVVQEVRAWIEDTLERGRASAKVPVKADVADADPAVSATRAGAFSRGTTPLPSRTSTGYPFPR